MIRVFIKRSLVEGKESDYRRTVRQLKQKACNMPGYISGEMLVDSENPKHCLVMSTWESIEYWQTWAKSDERKQAESAIRKMLTDDESISIYEAASMKAASS
ncbi:MAG: antibiotic biosynthesis monooxygenase [Gammaproteobacteria bacterium]|nr:antibiotic biosynthesis monooxygenase [Gammaproteobacteria bacterium]